VFLVDSHDIFRMGVRSALSTRDELTVVGEACDLDEGLDLVAQTRPDVVVVGIREHEVDVLDRLPLVRSRHPDTRFLVLSRSQEHDVLRAALRGGASGYLAKDIAADQLASAVKSIAGGHSLIGADRAMELATGTTGPAPTPPEGRLASLTPQEQRILSLIAEGLTNRQIGERLFLAEKTVRNHVTRLLAKLGVRRRTQAALIAADILGR
jgi:two-component system response regulator DevR